MCSCRQEPNDIHNRTVCGALDKTSHVIHKHTLCAALDKTPPVRRPPRRPPLRAEAARHDSSSRHQRSPRDQFTASAWRRSGNRFPAICPIFSPRRLIKDPFLPSHPHHPHHPITGQNAAPEASCLSRARKINDVFYPHWINQP